LETRANADCESISTESQAEIARLPRHCKPSVLELPAQSSLLLQQNSELAKKFSVFFKVNPEAKFVVFETIR